MPKLTRCVVCDAPADATTGVFAAYVDGTTIKDVGAADIRMQYALVEVPREKAYFAYCSREHFEFAQKNDQEST